MTVPEKLSGASLFSLGRPLRGLIGAGMVSMVLPGQVSTDVPSATSNGRVALVILG